MKIGTITFEFMNSSQKCELHTKHPNCAVPREGEIVKLLVHERKDDGRWTRKTVTCEVRAIEWFYDLTDMNGTTHNAYPDVTVKCRLLKDS